MRSNEDLLPYRDRKEEAEENELFRFAVVVALVALGVIVAVCAFSIAQRFNSFDAYMSAAFG